MDPTQQTLQNLPKHLVQKIACKATNWTPPDIYASLPCIGNPIWKMQKYVSICRSWRYSCMPLYCQDVSLTMDYKMQNIEQNHYWLATIPGISSCHGEQYSRYAHLQVPLISIINGKLPEAMQSAPYNSSVFPHVTVIWLKLSKGAKSQSSDLPSKDNVLLFVQLVRRIFPNAQICSITSSIVFDSLDEENEVGPYATLLFHELMRSMSGIKYFAASSHSFNTSLPQPATLSSITYFECPNSLRYFIELIRSNHRSLQSLYLETTSTDLPYRLVQPTNDGSGDLQYSQLNILSLECSEPAQVSAKYAPSSAVFPQLRQLILHQPYPFTNDALFRGNLKSLQQLSMHLQVQDILLLLRLGILTKQFTNVEHLQLQVFMRDYPFDKQMGSLIAHFPWQIAGSNLQSLSVQFDTFCYKDALLSALQQPSYSSIERQDFLCHQSLEFLRLNAVPLQIHQVLQVIEYLPRLVQLNIDPESIDFDKDIRLQDTVSSSQLLKLQKATQKQPHFASRLRKIVFGLGAFTDMLGAAHFAIQLVILCPRVERICWINYSVFFIDNCKQLADEHPLYKQFSSRLCLVDWNK
ncbi:hypothetical protein IWW36_004499 [Coemansia brasiliensis]|uniref:F-box domain-containing protein n=1 Tax=Coemansia brasiliensis TaxID=2650707 RepID=A0A9W8I5L5_9FUNG|nr:hypothetical protein IWW36_004499 [Coemansia brasiliensis]